jgi:hypothetical protein
MDNPSQPLLDALEREVKVKDVEDDGIDMLNDDNKSRGRSESWLSSYTSQSRPGATKKVDKVFQGVSAI